MAQSDASGGGITASGTSEEGVPGAASRSDVVTGVLLQDGLPIRAETDGVPATVRLTIRTRCVVARPLGAGGQSAAVE
jgi:hypothetical protein|eukprot:COSAG01_NODE_293_length_19376_cov_41.772060_22_plen_78_part_00